MKFGLLHFLIICIIWQASVSANGDLEALLSFKAHIVHDPLGVLASWNLSSSLHFCNSWRGVNCSLRHQRVMALNLSDSQLNGTLSASIANLTFLRVLDLSINSLTGTIPAEIGFSLPNLVFLDFSNNELSGTIPPSFGNLSALVELSMSLNNLRGVIPRELAKLLLRVKYRNI